MSSNSPVLLLAPTAVPTGPVLTPMLLTKMDARTLMSSQPPAKPAEVTASKAAESPSTNALTSMTATVTTTPTASKATATVAAKVSLSANAAPIVGPVTVPAAAAASSIPAPAMSPVSHVTSLVTPLSIQSPSSRLSAAMASSAPVTRPASISYTTPKRGAASIAAPPSPMSPPDSPSGSGASSPSSAASPKGGKSHTGRWTEAEHKLFLKGLEQFPYRAWKKIATLIKTRTVVQIRTHAQKYYQKLEKEEQRMREREAQLAAQQGTASVVSTPRAEPMSAPSTPAATPMSDLTPAASAFSLSATAVGSAADVTGAIGKRKAPLRKRKGSSDDEDELMPPSSLPKRMMKEKKFVREKTMSPKQKTAVAGSRVFNFGDGSSLTSDSSKSSSNSLRGFNAHPLDFDDADDVGTSASSMILDFAEEKPIVEYPFALDSALEHGLAGIDQDELLQLSDDENMEWFSSSTKDDVDEEQEEKESGDLLGSSPLEAFSPLYSEDCLQFVDPAPRASQVTTPSPILTSSPDFELSDDEHEEDDDFVLDPEKFLSSYFQPDNATSPKSA